MISNFKNIVEGWTSLIRAKTGRLSEDRLLLAEKRGEICIECPELIEEDRPLLSKYPFRCNVCGCVFPAIVLAKSKECPLGKW